MSKAKTSSQFKKYTVLILFVSLVITVILAGPYTSLFNQLLRNPVIEETFGIPTAAGSKGDLSQAFVSLVYNSFLALGYVWMLMLLISIGLHTLKDRYKTEVTNLQKVIRFFTVFTTLQYGAIAFVVPWFWDSVFLPLKPFSSTVLGLLIMLFSLLALIPILSMNTSTKNSVGSILAFIACFGLAITLTQPSSRSQYFYQIDVSLGFGAYAFSFFITISMLVYAVFKNRLLGVKDYKHIVYATGLTVFLQGVFLVLSILTWNPGPF